jgi:hypothetical protein
MASADRPQERTLVSYAAREGLPPAPTRRCADPEPHNLGGHLWRETNSKGEPKGRERWCPGRKIRRYRSAISELSTAQKAAAKGYKYR